jgi:hypothetical protein
MKTRMFGLASIMIALLSPAQIGGRGILGYLEISPLFVVVCIAVTITMTVIGGYMLATGKAR